MTRRDTPPRLGRGLAALLGDTLQGPATETARTTLPITALEPGPFQPRTAIDPARLADLTASIKQQGVLQPLLARPHPVTAGQYQIIAGERRWRAAQAAGLHDVPVLIRQLADTEAMAASLVENLQRQDLNPIEEAEGYKRLIEEFGLTQEQLGSFVGKSRSHVANTMRLLHLPGSVLGFVQSGALSAGHARALLTHSSPESAARAVIARGLNVRQTETLAQQSLHAPVPPQKPAPDRESAALERDLTAHLGLTVQLATNGTAGSLRIQFKSLDQLEGLIALLLRT
ncbi:MAG: ParB/RepB/Spo0J family partition protein [Gemmatimonadaceae bacterium]|nr:ParB/RepB/Spo0J family partition protein [Acetobacteraceae bacterium]